MRYLIVSFVVIAAACTSGEGYVEVIGARAGAYAQTTVEAGWLPGLVSPAGGAIETGDDRCTVEQVGACTIARCEPLGWGFSWPQRRPVPQWRDAGDVHLMAGSRRLPLLRDGDYWLLVEEELPPGTLLLDVGGAEVPGHSLSIPWPGIPDVTSHSDDADGLVLNWTPPPVDVDEMYVGISDMELFGGGTSVSCFVDPAAGSMRMDAALVAVVDRSAAYLFARMTLDRTVEIDRYPTTIHVDARANWQPAIFF